MCVGVMCVHVHVCIFAIKHFFFLFFFKSGLVIGSAWLEVENDALRLGLLESGQIQHIGVGQLTFQWLQYLHKAMGDPRIQPVSATRRPQNTL